MPKSRELRPLGNNIKQQNVEIPELKPMRKAGKTQKSLSLKELSIQFDDSWKLTIKEIHSIAKLIKRFATEMYKQNAEIEKELRKKATKEELASIWEGIDKRTQDIIKQLKAVRRGSHPSRTTPTSEAPIEILELIKKENEKFEEQLVKHEQTLKETLEKSIVIMKQKEAEKTVDIKEKIEIEKPKIKEGLLEDIEKHLVDFNDKALGRFIETKAILNDIELNILTRQKEFIEIIEQMKVENENVIAEKEEIESLEEVK